MKMKQFKFIILAYIIIALMVPSYVMGAKIQTNEQWQYRDASDKLFDEKTIEIVQYQPTKFDTAIAVAKVETKRAFSFPIDYYHSNSEYTIEFNMSIKNDGILFLTQEGGFPLFGNHSFVGTVELTLANGSHYSIEIDNPMFWINQAVPSDVFATAETVSFDRNAVFLDVVGDIQNQITFRQYYVISTNQEIKDDIRNYTITPNGILFTVRWNGISLNGPIEGGLTLNALEEATLITWDRSENIPTYIRQTEPITIESGLNLNQVQETKEYFLVINDDSDDGFLPLSFTIISSLVLIIFYRSYKKRRY